MLKNKHVIAALIIAPILAIISYFAVDHLVSEKPHKAEAGNSYKLVAKPNCRYASGRCSFKNGNFEADLQLKQLPQNELLVTLISQFPLQGAKISLSVPAEDSAIPHDMFANDENLLRWQLVLDKKLTEQSKIYLALAADDAIYYGETGTRFINYDTAFDEDFRR